MACTAMSGYVWMLYGQSPNHLQNLLLITHAKLPMSEIELQIKGNSTQRKHLDHQLHPSSEEPASDRVEDTVDTVTEPQACTAITIPSIVTKQETRIAHIQLFTLSWTMFLLGWNDGSLGPLLPKIQEVYLVGYMVVSLLFVAAGLGFITGSLVNMMFADKLGFGKILVLGSLCQVIAFTIQAPAPPFPLFATSYFINSFGQAIENILAIGYIVSLKVDSETKMGIMQAAYGAGALLTPISATQFAQMRHWSFHFLISLSIAIVNTINLITVFRFRTHDECLVQIGDPISEQGTSSDSKFHQILNQRTVHLLALFSLVYIGVEFTIGGWIVTFINVVRGGGPSSGYISVGYFAGMMFGRIGLLWVNKRVGERRVLFIYALLAIVLEIIIWFVPSVIGDAIAVSLVGVLLGPMYPIAMNHAGRVLPRWLLTSSISWIAGFGQVGSVVLPFITGAFSSKFGVKNLQPLWVAMMSVMTLMWALVPGVSRRTD